MKKICLIMLIALTLVPCSLSAQGGHRIGVGLGSASGTHDQNGEKTDLKGENLELPLYSYVADSGLMIGFRLMEFSISGEIESGLQRTDISYKQTLLAASIGIEIPLGDSVMIAPQIIKSYFGNSRFHYSTYNTYTAYPDNYYEYVTDTGTIKGTAELSGWEIPVYYVGEYFLVGMKFSAYNDTTEVEWPAGSTSEVGITGALSFVLDARF